MSKLFLILISLITVSCSLGLKQEENKSLADILKLVNQHPGLEIRVEFGHDEIEDQPITEPPTTKKPSSKIPAVPDNSTLLLVNQLNRTSTNIMEVLNKTAIKLDEVLKRLNTIEKLFQEKPKELKEQKFVQLPRFNQSNQTDNDFTGEDDKVADLLLS